MYVLRCPWSTDAATLKKLVRAARASIGGCLLLPDNDSYKIQYIGPTCGHQECGIANVVVELFGGEGCKEEPPIVEVGDPCMQVEPLLG